MNLNVSDMLTYTPDVTVQDLRNAGYKVRVTHQRQWKDDTFSHKSLNAKGGFTTVEVRTPLGQELIGNARCSNNDTYNKKLGVRIALGRAFKGI